MWRASTRLAVNVHHSDSSTDDHLGAHAQPLTYELGTRPSAELRKKAKDAHTCGCQHRRDPNYLVQRLQMTLSHSIPSMTLTSVSTILGLLVNLMSSIVAVQRFAVFSVLLVLCNFIFVILTAPIVFLLFDSFYYESFTHRLHQLSRLLSAFILRACLILPCVSILAVCIAFYHLFFAHRFHLAQTGGKMSSFFSSTHPFEEFVNEQSQWFWAERNLHHYSNLLEAHFVWGFLPKDGRSFLTFDPDVHGLYSTKWVPDHILNLTSPSSRRWISDFCNNHLKQFPYLFRLSDAISHTELYSPLGISHLKPYTTSPVWCPLGRFPNSVNNFVFAQACQSSSEHCCPSGHPLDVLDAPDTQFRSCLGEYVSYHLHTFPREYHSGYRFSFTGHSNEPVALILTVLTNLSTTTSTHAELRRFTENVASWFQASLLNAPASLIGGQVVVPALAAFEVTLNVVQYIHWSVLSSVFLATLLVLLSSLNMWLSVLAFLSLSSCLLTTVATLITFDHWTLGVVEGLVISLAAGLAIDPCIHLAVSVSSRTAKSSTVCRLFTFWSDDAVLQSVTVLSNAVTGSAFSTAIAGLSMVTCRLLCYHQIGAFLATLMSFSWLFCYLLFAGCLACCSRLFRTRRSNS
ncbi:unnamed protein product [Dicrocoelium dendriticum]|nr:unnamed protein product [Dicrocoelium dendriticum]